MPLQLATTPPFHLEATVRVLQRRPTNLVDRWDGRHYQRLFELSNESVLAEVTNLGSTDAPDLQLSLRRGSGGAPPAALRAVLVSRVRAMLGLDVAIRPLQSCLEAEPRLQQAAQGLRGMRPPRFPDLFETFASVVPFQQVSLDAGVAVLSRLVLRFAPGIELAGRRFHAFPAAALIAASHPSSLRACGMSWQKARTLREVARRIEEGSLRVSTLQSMTTPDALALLRSIPGIGPWSAALVLLRGFGRLDVFPPGDSGAIGSLLELTRLRSPASLERIIRRFGDYRGYLYFCGIGGRLLAARLIRAPASAGPA
jgi:DNA-3-methyladenine glycosylase II